MKTIKRLKKIIGKFLYYDMAIDLTTLMALNSLAVIQIKLKIVTAKKITQFLNYSAKNSDKVTEYRRIQMKLHIYSNGSYIS